jgi:hypothetical protein
MDIHDLEMMGLMAILGRSSYEKGVIADGETGHILQLSELGRVLFNPARVPKCQRRQFSCESAGVGFNLLVGAVEDSKCWFGGIHRWYLLGEVHSPTEKNPTGTLTVTGWASAYRSAAMGLEPLDADVAVPWW